MRQRQDHPDEASEEETWLAPPWGAPQPAPGLTMRQRQEETWLAPRLRQRQEETWLAPRLRQRQPAWLLTRRQQGPHSSVPL